MRIATHGMKYEHISTRCWQLNDFDKTWFSAQDGNLPEAELFLLLLLIHRMEKAERKNRFEREIWIRKIFSFLEVPYEPLNVITLWQNIFYYINRITRLDDDFKVALQSKAMRLAEIFDFR